MEEMEERFSRVRSLFLEAGYPAFDLDSEGFPNPGQVAKFFREQTTYTLPNGRVMNWTQKEFAKVLKCSEVSVRLMENNSVGLDSVLRRRLVGDVLKIPPILLGFGSFEQLITFLTSAQQSTTLASSPLEKETITLYQDAAKVSWELYYLGTAQASIAGLTPWINRVTADLPKANEPQQHQLTEILCSYYQIVACLYGDRCQYDKAFECLDTALEVAIQLGKKDLQAAILYRTGHIRLDQRQFLLAKRALDGALALVKDASPALQGAIFQTTGLASALVAHSDTERTQALVLLDEAEKIVLHPQQIKEDPHFVKVNQGRYFLERADTLLAIGRPAKALSLLDEADEGIAHSQSRRRAYMTILRAEASMRKKRPEFDMATHLLLEALHTSRTIQSRYNMGYIRRLVTKIEKSPYGNAPDVRDLGIALKQPL
jgi:tetratricopeptide (TPR) repeat protein